MTLVGDILIILGFLGFINPKLVLRLLRKKVYKYDYNIPKRKVDIIRLLSLLWIITGLMLVYKG